MANAGTANPVVAAIGQEIGMNMGGSFGKKLSKSGLRTQGSFLFCIPIQVGPASPYTRNVRHWMHAILVLQAAVCVVRFVWLMDFLGGFWMLLLCGLGWYSWHQDMNITYICLWGLGCSLNGVFDTLALILPLVFDMIRLQFLEILLRSMIPVSELLGAAFSWHLYVDYYKHGGGAEPQNPMAKWIDKMPDPMGHVVDEVDPEEATSLLRGIKKGTDHFDAHKSLDVVNHGLMQGSKALTGGLKAGSEALRQGQGVAKDAAKDARQTSWLQGFGDKSPFQGLGDKSAFQGLGDKSAFQSLRGDGGADQKPKIKAPCC